MKNLVNGSNFARYSDFVFSEIVSKEEFDSLKEKNNNLIIVREYNYLKLNAIWYINPIIELEDNDNVSLPLSLDENYHVYHQYVIKVKNRDKLKDYLYKHKIQSGIYYPKPCHMQNPYKNIKVDSPISEKLSKEVLALPIAEHISQHDVKNICKVINNFFK